MKKINFHFGVAGSVFLLGITLCIILLVAVPSYGHGPKGHGNTKFTPLSAVKKGLKLYDRLLANGKLDESWEIEFNDIKVVTHEQNDKKELVVQFNRKDGNPRSVFIFFDKNGDYTGSNYTGN